MDDIDEIEILFWEKVDKKGPDECWLWIGGVDRDGYGRQRFNGRPVGAHRISYELANGSLPAGMSVLHCTEGFCRIPYLKPYLGNKTKTEKLQNTSDSESGAYRIRTCDFHRVRNDNTVTSNRNARNH